jgi:hypothetical protein
LGTARSALDAVIGEKSVLSEADEALAITAFPAAPSAEEGIAVGEKGEGSEEIELQEEDLESERLIAPAEERIEELPIESQMADEIESEKKTEFEEDLSKEDKDLSNQESIIADDKWIFPGESGEGVFVLKRQTIRIAEYLLATFSIFAAFAALITRKARK